MKNAPIGVFDSGLGGLSCVRALRELLPCEDIVYFGDTGRVPYGTRSEDTIRRYASEDIDYLLSKDCKVIIAACGTVSSVAGDLLDALPTPATGVVKHACKRAVSVSSNKKVGVIGTGATISSGSYEREIKALDPTVQVFAQACPMFVPLVENGWFGAEDDVAKLAVERYLKDIKAAGVDVLILGCTHFPLLSEVIGNFMGDGVTLIDTGKEAAVATKEFLSENNLLTDSVGEGKCSFAVSDSVEQFSTLGKVFLQTEIKDNVELVRL